MGCVGSFSFPGWAMDSDHVFSFFDAEEPEMPTLKKKGSSRRRYTTDSAPAKPLKTVASFRHLSMAASASVSQTVKIESAREIQPKVKITHSPIYSSFDLNRPKTPCCSFASLDRGMPDQEAEQKIQSTTSHDNDWHDDDVFPFELEPPQTPLPPPSTVSVLNPPSIESTVSNNSPDTNNSRTSSISSGQTENRRRYSDASRSMASSSESDDELGLISSRDRSLITPSQSITIPPSRRPSLISQFSGLSQNCRSGYQPGITTPLNSLSIKSFVSGL